MGAAQIAAGDADIIVAGGTESITMLQNDMNMKNLPNPWVGEHKPGIYHPMGMTAEKVAEKYKISREYAGRVRARRARSAPRRRRRPVTSRTRSSR